MNGVLIKDFKMPETCLDCPMQFGGMCYVQPADVDDTRVAPTVDEAWEQKKPKWCPLVDYECPETKIVFKDMDENEVTIGDKVYNDDGFHKVYGVIKFGEYHDRQTGGHIGVYIEWQDDGLNEWSKWWRQDILFWLPKIRRC